MIHKRKFVIVGAILALGASLEAAVVTVGYFTDAGLNPPSTSTKLEKPITDNGFTPLQITDIAAFVAAGNLSRISILMIATTNNNNTGPSAALVAQSAALSNWVAGGGVIAFHDRNVCNPGLGVSICTPVPGSAGITFVRLNFGDPTNNGTNIDVETPGTLVTNGPFGIINNTTLDNGSSSNNGYATVPAGVLGILNNGTPGREVAFSYPFGRGWVYYSTIALSIYLDPPLGFNPPPLAAFQNIYAPNVVAYLGCLASVSTCTAPAPAGLTAAATGAPSVSEWGLGILAILLMACAAVMLRSGQAKGAR